MIQPSTELRRYSQCEIHSIPALRRCNNLAYRQRGVGMWVVWSRMRNVDVETAVKAIYSEMPRDDQWSVHPLVWPEWCETARRSAPRHDGCCVIDSAPKVKR